MEQPFDLPAELTARRDPHSGDAPLAVAVGVSAFTALKWTNGQAIPPQRHHVGIAAFVGVDVEVVSAYCRAAWAKRGRR